MSMDAARDGGRGEGTGEGREPEAKSLKADVTGADETWRTRGESSGCCWRKARWRGRAVEAGPDANSEGGRVDVEGDGATGRPCAAGSKEHQQRSETKARQCQTIEHGGCQTRHHPPSPLHPSPDSSSLRVALRAPRPLDPTPAAASPQAHPTPSPPHKSPTHIVRPSQPTNTPSHTRTWDPTQIHHTPHTPHTPSRHPHHIAPAHSTSHPEPSPRPSRHTHT